MNPVSQNDVIESDESQFLNGYNHEQDKSSALPRRLTDLMFGFCASQALFAACEVGIFDALHDAGCPLSAATLSQKLSINYDATCRILDALSCMELLNKHDEETYSNTSIATKHLTMSSPHSVQCSMAFGNNVLYNLFGNLTWAVREGTNQWSRSFNKTCARDFFKEVFATEKSCIRFMEGMRGTCRPAAKSVVTAFDLSGYHHMCDLGGCTGDIAYAACSEYPDMKITVLDVPQVTACSSHFAPSVDDCPNKHNVSFVAGDFFESKLPTADLYVLTHIIHNWSQDKIDVLLANIFNNLPSGGALLIGETLLKDSKTGPFVGVLASLSMLVLCDEGARERSGPEYKELLERQGFADVRYRRTGSDFMDAILCKKT